MAVVLRLLSVFLMMVLCRALRLPVYMSSRRIATNSNVVVVIGGGAAGYFSAIACASELKKCGVDKKVYVVEAGRSVLSKVLISGGGRCNVMHNPEKPPAEISMGYPRGRRELLGPLTARFGPKETRDWFTSRGVSLKTERDGRVFPTTDRSSTIAGTLKQAALSAGVEVLTGVKVVGVRASVPSTDQQTAPPRKFVVTYQSGTGSQPATVGGADTRGGDGGAVLKSRRSSLYEGLGSTDYVGTDVNGGGGLDGDSAVVTTRAAREMVQLECDRVIVATGSSRLGYDIVRGLGHDPLDPLPSLFSFKINDPTLTALSGVSTKNAKVQLLSNASKPLSGEGLVQRGPLLVTKQGISGPAVLKLSAFGARLMSEAKYRFAVEVGWLGDLSAAQVLEHLQAAKQAHGNRLVSKHFPQLNAELESQVRAGYPVGSPGPTGSATGEGDHEDLAKYGAVVPAEPRENGSEPESAGDSLIPRRLWLYLLQRAGLVDSQLKWRQLTAQQLAALAKELTQGVYSVEGRGLYRDEFVTCGGVKLKEVHFKTMESRACPGLYLAGEVLDIDGITGGYNFQSAWTTGYIAGHSCAQSLLSAEGQQDG